MLTGCENASIRIFHTALYVLLTAPRRLRELLLHRTGFASQQICTTITVTTARHLTRKDSPPALFYVKSSHTPPTPPTTARKGAFQGQSPTKNRISCDARDSAGSLPPVTSMISLTMLLASATVAAAAKKVEDAPAPGIVDTILGFVVDPVKHYQHRTIIPLEGGHGSTLGGTIATMASATAACLFLAATPDLLALARGGADKGSAEAIAWTLGTALGLKYVAKLTRACVTRTVNGTGQRGRRARAARRAPRGDQVARVAAARRIPPSTTSLLPGARSRYAL